MYSERFTLKNCDFSFQDKIKPQAIAEICEEISGRDAKNSNNGYLSLKERNLAWVIVRTRVEILKDLKNGFDAIVKTAPIVPGKIDFDRNYYIYNLDNELCVKSTTKWIVIDYTTRRIQRSSVCVFPKEELEINALCNFKKVTCNSSLENVVMGAVKLNDLDHNGHMNNARYIEMIYNTFNKDEKRNLIAYECEYVKELMYNETIKIKYNNTYSEYQILNSNDEVSFVMKLEWR